MTIAIIGSEMAEVFTELVIENKKLTQKVEDLEEEIEHLNEVLHEEGIE